MTDFTEFPIPTKSFNPADFTGADGREVEFQETATHLQWRYVGSETWIDLVSIETLRGPNGRNPEFQRSATHIQWRLEGDAEWIDLVPLADLMPQNAVTSTDISSIAVVAEGAIPDPADPNTLYVEMPA